LANALPAFCKYNGRSRQDDKQTNPHNHSATFPFIPQS
jgi:hypothetical protein